MNVYKIVFAKNSVLSCVEVKHQIKLDAEWYYEHEKGKAIFAIIQAPDPNEAITKANKLLQEVREKHYGNDFT